MSYMDTWDKLARPPQSALKNITGGRLKGMTDINPQWRYKAMTEVFGKCGEGWNYEIVRVWTESGADGQVFAFAQVNVVTNGCSPVPGIGGSMLIEKDRNGLHHNDEAFKMAITDALSVAMKMLGVGADIYMGRFDGTKYKDERQAPKGSAAEVMQDAYSALDADGKAWVDNLAMEVVALHGEGADGPVLSAHIKNALGENYDHDFKVALWSRLPSQVKTAISKVEKK